MLAGLSPLRLSLAAALLLLSGAVHAMEPFVVRDMRVEGLARISEGTVFNYLPVSLGDRLDAQRVQEGIRAVYATGLFRDVEFRREGNTLVISVTERPSIRSFTIEGNKDIKTEDLEDSLRNVGLARGKTFNRSVLEDVTQYLTEQYYGRGKYNVQVDTTVTENPEDNTVDIAVDIAEGKRARIRQINLVGNQAFSDEEIVDEFESQTPNWLSFYKQDDRYARETLLGDLEKLQSFYMDRGYAAFEVESTQVAISPDKQNIYITVNVEEGEPYVISDIKLAGDLVLPEAQLERLVLAKPGETFSRRLLTQSAELMTYRLGEEGFAFARVDPVPDVNPETNEVAITFYVDPGKRAYVRRINYYGTQSTEDEVFRREMRQMEGGFLSNRALERSEQRIRRLPFVEEVSSETDPVPGTDDLVDVSYQIKEGLPGSFGGGVGYSGSQGVILNGNVVHTNFLGRGNRVEADISTGRYATVYRFLHTDPYVTMDGVSRTVSAAYRDITQYTSGASDFSTKTLTLGLEYSYPITEYTRIRYGFSAQRSDLLTDSSSPLQSQRWVRLNGDSTTTELRPGVFAYQTKFTSYELVLGWSYDSRNRFLFADRGTRSRVSLNYALPFGDVEYYTLRLDYLQYVPLFGPLFIEWNARADYGDSLGDTTEIPPYDRFFGGGPTSVRGFKEGYLGPRDSQNRPYGGNLRVASQVELILPSPETIADSTRFGLFFDAGNVFSTDTTPFIDQNLNPVSYDFSFDEFRYSVGASVQWLAPIGLFRVSYGIPLNDKPEDDTEGFQFTIGSAF
ncbi:MAG: outer membrane protein assembly factor BamA [Gammaproteobacteria bacterium]